MEIVKSKIETVASSKLKGTTWEDVDVGDIAMITVSYGRTISYLQFLYVKDGLFTMSKRNGEPIENLEVIQLNHPDEYLIGVIGGHGVIDHGKNETNRVLKSITFKTNKNTYGPFPKIRSFRQSEDTEFSINVLDRGWINGFHGTTFGGQLESFGVHIKSVPTTITPEKDKNDCEKIDVVAC